MKTIAITSSKGGVGKTTTAIHAAYWFAEQKLRTILIDGDSNRSGLKWQARSEANDKFIAPFSVASYTKMAKAVQGADIVIIDTAASIEDDDLKDLSEDCDVIIIPTKTDIDSAAAATETADKTIAYGGNYYILITDSPSVGSSRSELLADLKDSNYSVFNQCIRRGEGVRHASLVGATLAQQPGAYRRPWVDYQTVFKEMSKLLGI